MPRVSYIAPPINFSDDRGQQIVAPMLANANALAETFATEIPKIRMQQDAVQTEQNRYDTGLKMQQEGIVREQGRYDEGLRMKKSAQAKAEREHIRTGLTSNLDMDAVDLDGDGKPDNLGGGGRGRSGLSTLPPGALSEYQQAKLALVKSKGTDERAKQKLIQHLSAVQVDTGDMMQPKRLMTPEEVQARVEALLVNPNADVAEIAEAQKAQAPRGTLMRTPEKTAKARDYLRQLKAHVAANPELAEDPQTIAEYERLLADAAPAAAPPAPTPAGEQQAEGAVDAGFDFSALPNPADLPRTGGYHGEMNTPPALPAPKAAAPLPVRQNAQGRDYVPLTMNPAGMISNTPWQGNVTPEKAMRIPDLTKPQTFAGDDRNFGLSNIKMPADQGGSSPYQQELNAVKSTGAQALAALSTVDPRWLDAPESGGRNALSLDMRLYQKETAKAEAALQDAFTAGTPGAYQRYLQAIQTAHAILTESLLPAAQRIQHMPNASELGPVPASTDPSSPNFAG